MNQEENFDPNTIIQAAEEKRRQNDISGAEMMYKSALLDWVDAAREGGVRDPEQAREAIATLWLAYAQFNQSNNMVRRSTDWREVNARALCMSHTLTLLFLQFKSATEAYEQAIVCPVAGSVGRVWLEYARFAQDRDKLRTAQKIYLRALVGDATTPAAVTDEQDRNLLWSEFLEMMKQTKPELTMAALKKAVEEEHLQSTNSASMERASPDPITSDGVSPDAARPEKRPRLGSSPVPPVQTKTHVVTAESVSTEADGLLDLIQGGMPPEISAAWFVRDGDSPPSPPKALFTPSPPKMADPTGKEILGTKLALAVITSILKKDDTDKSGSILLEACRGLWMLSALKEQMAADKLDSLDQSMVSYIVNYERVDERLNTRLNPLPSYSFIRLLKWKSLRQV